MKATGERGPRRNNLSRLLRVLAVLAAVVILCPNPTGITRRIEARRNKALIDITIIALAVGFFRAQTQRYPTRLEELVTRPADAPRWGGPYLDGTTVPLDPWGRPYVYVLDGLGYTIICYGADGADGGTGDDADIIHHPEEADR